jgi:SAM-dependent methyltransferase
MVKIIPMDWTDRYFDTQYAKFFLEGVDSKRTADQIDFIIEKTGIPKNSTIADIGCGLGRHVIEFAKRGHSVTGYDFNPEYIQKTKEAASELGIANAEFVAQDCRKFNETARFDLVTSLWVSFGYFDDATNQDILMRMAKSLKPDGKIFIDLENREYILKHYIVDRYRDRQGTIILERNKFEMFTSVNKCTRTIIEPDGKRNVITREVRLYTLTEMVRMGRACSIEFDTVFGDWDGKSYGTEVPRMILVGRTVK